MNQELTLRLVKRFPVLYQDYRSPMTQTAMCWGFDHGDGLCRDAVSDDLLTCGPQ